MSDAEPRLYTADEWARMDAHDRAVIAEDRRRAVEAAAEEHRARKALDDSLTLERFGHDPR